VSTDAAARAAMLEELVPKMIPRRCHSCGGHAPGDICVTSVLPGGRVFEDMPICRRCSRDLNALSALMTRLSEPAS
jgi:hypothetical protein